MTTAKRRRSRDEWARLIDEMQASGLSQSAWCKQRGINYRSMQSMKDVLRKASLSTEGPETGSKTAKAPIPAGFVRLSSPDDILTPAFDGQHLTLTFGRLIVTVEMTQ